MKYWHNHALNYYQECMKLSREKIRMSLTHANVIKDHERLHAELREQSQEMERIEVGVFVCY